MKESQGASKQLGSSIKRFIVMASLVAMVFLFSFLFIKNHFSLVQPVINDHDAVVHVGRLMKLPDESVHVSRVETPELLRAVYPDLYQDVQLGDYILEYKTMLIIYRPGEDRIIRSVNK